MAGQPPPHAERGSSYFAHLAAGMMGHVRAWEAAWEVRQPARLSFARLRFEPQAGVPAERERSSRPSEAVALISTAAIAIDSATVYSPTLRWLRRSPGWRKGGGVAPQEAAAAEAAAAAA